MKDVLSLIGRNKELFIEDIDAVGSDLYNKVSTSSFLVIGGAGSIGQAVTKEIFKRNPKKLHVVDISENNLVELVRDIRSSLGYIDGEFATFALDIGSVEYDAFIKSDGEYDYVLNLSALKHVRSEKDPYTLMRMINTNIFYTVKTIQQSVNSGVKKYFCVSTDKAANPVNMMGASKRIMELFAVRESRDIDISMARFANVAFSDGSLLHGFNQRVFFPKLSEDLHLITFADIATKYLKGMGYEPYLCTTEEEARKRILDLPQEGKWPCLFTKSDTTGEKDFEEFFTDKETLDMIKFEKLGIIKSELQFDEKSLDAFERVISQMKDNKSWEKAEIVAEFKKLIPDFGHKETGRYLDGKM